MATRHDKEDAFGLARGLDRAGGDVARAAVAERLAVLPHRQIVLGQDNAANGALLAKIADEL